MRLTCLEREADVRGSGQLHAFWQGAVAIDLAYGAVQNQTGALPSPVLSQAYFLNFGTLGFLALEIPNMTHINYFRVNVYSKYIHINQIGAFTAITDRPSFLCRGQWGSERLQLAAHEFSCLVKS